MVRFRSSLSEPRAGRSIAISGLIPLLFFIVLSQVAVGQDDLNRPRMPLINGLPALPPALDRAIPTPPALGFVDGINTNSTALKVKVGQGQVLKLKESLIVPGKPSAFVAVGDPSVLEFAVIGPQHLRLIGKKLGTTDLSLTMPSNETVVYEVQVVIDLDMLRAELRQRFPDASLKVGQLREKIVVEGQARDSAQVNRIIAAIDTYVVSVQRIQVIGQVANLRVDANAPPVSPVAGGAVDPLNPAFPLANLPSLASSMNLPNRAGPSDLASAVSGASMSFGNTALTGAPLPSPGAATTNQIASNQTQVINLIRVPTSQQVLLKVRVAELNRTAFREIGADLLASIPQFGTLFGTQIAGNGLAAGRIGSTTFGSPGNTPGSSVVTPDARSLTIGSQGTLYGTFSHGQFNAVLTALRKNNLVKILAEPNLVALNGYQANFLAGGSFPVPSPSGVAGGGSGGGSTSTTQFKEYGVRLSFLPIVLDNETVRLTVDPEVSSIDFSVATTLVPGGTPVPGLVTRSSHTTVELKQGETLAIAGLMQLELDGATQKIPGLGDLPYIGTFFSNTTSNRVEKELIVLITPYIIEPMRPDQVPPLPGDEVKQPNDLEFFFLNRIEGRTGIDGRATTSYDDPLHLIRHSIVERKYLVGPSGYSK